MALSPEDREGLEHDLEVLRSRRARTTDDRDRDEIGRQLDALANRLAAPDGFDTYSEFTQLDHIMRQPPH